MSVGQVAVRYAKALFQLAIEQNVLDVVRADMEILLQSATEIPEINQLFESPVIDSGKKTQVLKEIFKSGMSPMGLDFLTLVTSNKREEYLPGMARHFIQLYKREKGIMVATIYSAVGLEKQSGEKIRKMIEAAFDSEIELKEELKEELIGGFILRVEDKQLDASVKGKLATVKKELQK
jgi:F-type H+-transporting ATPase subunit delta